MLYKDFDLVLASDRIRITPLLPSDTESYARLMFGVMYDRFTEVLGHVPDSGIDKVLSHESDEETHALRLPDSDDSFIGWIALQRDEEGRPDIGIHIVPEQQNKGLGPEAIRLFANHLHDEYGLERVYARVHESNLQSQRAMEKAGAVLEKEAPNPIIVAMQSKLPEEERSDPGRLRYYHLDLPV